MTLSELQNVPSFVIKNNFGKIEFHPPSNKTGLDLTGVDLSSFEITEGEVEGYLND